MLFIPFRRQKMGIVNSRKTVVNPTKTVVNSTKTVVILTKTVVIPTRLLVLETRFRGMEFSLQDKIRGSPPERVVSGIKLDINKKLLKNIKEVLLLCEIFFVIL